MTNGPKTRNIDDIYRHPGAGTPTPEAIARETETIKNSSTAPPVLVLDEGDKALLVGDPAILDAHLEFGTERVPVVPFDGSRTHALRIICKSDTVQTSADLDAIILDARATEAPDNTSTASDAVVANMLDLSNHRIQVARDRDELIKAGYALDFVHKLNQDDLPLWRSRESVTDNFYKKCRKSSKNITRNLTKLHTKHDESAKQSLADFATDLTAEERRAYADTIMNPEKVGNKPAHSSSGNAAKGTNDAGRHDGQRSQQKLDQDTIGTHLTNKVIGRGNMKEISDKTGTNIRRISESFRCYRPFKATELAIIQKMFGTQNITAKGVERLQAAGYTVGASVSETGETENEREQA